MSYILVLLADWANGIFAVVLASLVSSTEVAWWHYFVGIALSHSPDLDALPELWRRGRVGADAEHESDHRDGLHYPLALLAVGVLATWLFGYWGWVMLFSLMLHLVNDLYGTGWGLKLFWPLSNRQYKLLGRRVNMAKCFYIRKVTGKRFRTMSGGCDYSYPGNRQNCRPTRLATGIPNGCNTPTYE